ncbi:MAG: DsrE family protein [Spirochaetes bacterium]|nr:DsrE family protein [Spirochaetota bacterium]
MPGLSGEEKLVVLWTSADREVALKMAFMYTLNSKNFGWWEDITLVVWGPSAKLLSEDTELQDYIKRMLSLGITVKACKMCADSYGVTPQLEELGITVKLMSELTDYLKEGRKILTL